ncbi:Asp-tRNA(Asn) amidotransferase subunit GatC [Methanobrevibacter filiformis]|uniref:Aspartyl/glutamyl-tRNA amidotransferase subunit C n=1 Tax=Methanobrevibacter filiformis TaxID=55758 RepID=A0A166FE15_9EURY|nr:Asp-tRNA(Asn) amidotransferase subunit GatC [Methanobrevibacter filiformis]KZX17579.1 aspartyl/glutamyl-tRNA amidotransferase subunit C [Methanobrevibacter filiformis]
MKIEKDAEKILKEFSKTLESIPSLEETHYIVDNVNLSREDKAMDKNPEKIMRNAKSDKDGNIIVKKAKWIN